MVIIIDNMMTYHYFYSSTCLHTNVAASAYPVTCFQLTWWLLGWLVQWS